MVTGNMENVNFEDAVKNIAKIVLTSPQKMIREEDLRILSRNFDFEEIISAVYLNLQNIGFEFIKSMFLDQVYYVLTSEGKDDDVTPSQYGTLALILALSKEIDESLEIKELEDQMITDLSDTEYSEAHFHASIIISFIDGLSPFIFSAISIVPFLFVLLDVIGYLKS